MSLTRWCLFHQQCFAPNICCLYATAQTMFIGSQSCYAVMTSLDEGPWLEERMISHCWWRRGLKGSLQLSPTFRLARQPPLLYPRLLTFTAASAFLLMCDRLLGRPWTASTSMPGAGRDVRLGVSARILVDKKAAHVDWAGAWWGTHCWKRRSFPWEVDLNGSFGLRTKDEGWWRRSWKQSVSLPYKIRSTELRTYPMLDWSSGLKNCRCWVKMSISGTLSRYI